MNNHQTESKNKGKNPTQLSNLMLQRDKNKIQNRNPNKNLDILRKPRSQEYISLAKMLTNLSKEIKEVEKQIEKESKKEAEKVLETKGKLLQLKERHQSLLEEFKYTMEQMVKEIPMPERILGIIYPDFNEPLLIKYGIISCPGEGFCTEEELIQNIKPDNKRIEEQWRKGYREYCSNRDYGLLLTEVYEDTVCVVFKNGETLVTK